MSTAAKSPGELIADLTDQVRLLRQDVGNLTATATTKAEAAKLMAGMQKATRDALEQNRQVSETAAEMSRRMHRDSLTAAQEAAGQAVRGLEDKISAAANHMRLEALKGRQQAFYSFGGGRVSEVVEIVWRRNLRVNQHPPNRRRQPPGRSRHEAEYR